MKALEALMFWNWMGLESVGWSIYAILSFLILPPEGHHKHFVVSLLWYGSMIFAVKNIGDDYKEHKERTKRIREGKTPTESWYEQGEKAGYYACMGWEMNDAIEFVEELAKKRGITIARGNCKNLLKENEGRIIKAMANAGWDTLGLILDEYK